MVKRRLLPLCRSKTGGLFGGDQTAPGRGEDEQDVEGGHGQGAEEGGFTLGIHDVPPGTSGRA